jgi:broad specificity phosphatase PhoE
VTRGPEPDPQAGAPPDRARGVIFLARHGRPALDRTVTLDWRGYRRWWADYDLGGLATDQEPGPQIRAAAAAADVILASPLRRAQETAAAVAGSTPVVTDPLFVEAPLPSPPIPGLALKPPAWGAVARASWWCGFAFGQESRPEAEARAERAAERVLAEASGGRTVLVCAHGWFNRMMRPALRRRGWVCTEDGRDHYWAVRRFEPRR